MPKYNTDELRGVLGGAKNSVLYIVGENHDVSAKQRDLEKQFCEKKLGASSVFLEDHFSSGQCNAYGNPVMADPLDLRTRTLLTSAIAEILKGVQQYQDTAVVDPDFLDALEDVSERLGDAIEEFESACIAEKITDQNRRQFHAEAIYCQVANQDLYKEHLDLVKSLEDSTTAQVALLQMDNPDLDDLEDCLCDLAEGLHVLDQKMAGYEYDILSASEELVALDTKREIKMLEAAASFQCSGAAVVWKIGDDHVCNMLSENCSYKELVEKANCVLMTKETFGEQLELFKAEMQRQEKVTAAKSSVSKASATFKKLKL